MPNYTEYVKRKDEDTMLDATTLSLPLFTALSCIGALGTLCVWIYSTFERKDDARDRHDILQERVISQEHILREVSQDVSYIRGKIDGER